MQRLDYVYLGGGSQEQISSVVNVFLKITFHVSSCSYT